MLITEKDLTRQIQQALLFERRSPGNVKTRKGKEVPWGSLKHVTDLQASLDELIRIRNAQPRTSKSRYIYARAVEETRKQFRSARRHGIRQGWIEEEL
mgnify:CR=1 FL=1|jgi:hypothetical protein